MDYQIILISGVARSGKSTVAYQLHQHFGYSYLGTDDIRFMAEKRFTEWEKPFEKGTRNDSVWQQVEPLIRTRSKFGRENDGFIIEGDVLTPARIARVKDVPNIQTICMAYPNVSVEDKFQQIRDYHDAYDWTDKLSDEELRQQVEKLITRSGEFQAECQAENIRFIDTSDFHSGMKEALKCFSYAQETM